MFSLFENQPPIFGLSREAVKQPGRGSKQPSLGYAVWSGDVRDRNGGARPRKHPVLGVESLPRNWWITPARIKRMKNKKGARTVNRAVLPEIKSMYRQWSKDNWTTRAQKIETIERVLEDAQRLGPKKGLQKGDQRFVLKKLKPMREAQAEKEWYAARKQERAQSREDWRKKKEEISEEKRRIQEEFRRKREEAEKKTRSKKRSPKKKKPKVPKVKFTPPSKRNPWSEMLREKVLHETEVEHAQAILEEAEEILARDIKTVLSFGGKDPLIDPSAIKDTFPKKLRDRAVRAKERYDALAGELEEGIESGDLGHIGHIQDALDTLAKYVKKLMKATLKWRMERIKSSRGS